MMSVLCSKQSVSHQTVIDVWTPFHSDNINLDCSFICLFIHVPRVCGSKNDGRAFSYKASLLWNQLSALVQEADSPSTFEVRWRPSFFISSLSDHLLVMLLYPAGVRDFYYALSSFILCLLSQCQIVLDHLNSHNIGYLLYSVPSSARSTMVMLGPTTLKIYRFWTPKWDFF